MGLRTRDPRWHCERTFQLALGDGKAEIFFIDTSPFIEDYRNVSWFDQEGATPGADLSTPQSAPVYAQKTCKPAPWRPIFTLTIVRLCSELRFERRHFEGAVMFQPCCVCQQRGHALPWHVQASCTSRA